jgi:hypothetical protein
MDKLKCPHCHGEFVIEDWMIGAVGSGPPAVVYVYCPLCREEIELKGQEASR